LFRGIQVFCRLGGIGEKMDAFYEESIYREFSQHPVKLIFSIRLEVGLQKGSGYK
jgi:hypothetical protein